MKRVAELEKTKGRKKSGKFLIEGPQSVREIVRWMPAVVEDCYVQMDERQSGLLSPVVEDIAREADEQGLYIHQVAGDVMHRMSTDAQGIVAVGNLETVQNRMIDDFEHSESGYVKIAKVFHNVATRGTDVMSGAETDDNATNADSQSSENKADSVRFGDTVAAFWQIRDPGNAGTVIRSADAAGCRAVIFVDDCVDRFNPKVIRSTTGSLFHLPVVTMSTDEFFAWAEEQHREVMAADVYGTQKIKPESLIDVVAGFGDSQSGHTDDHNGRSSELLSDNNKAGNVRNEGNTSSQNAQCSCAILFGNEARGLPNDVLERVQRIVSIPLYGKAESLNLATSTSVMLFTLAMARDAAQRR
ncbi:RNA methyltransferase [Bifidobacterium sp. ESL0769]|uniref:TrmH family RNA methyltransferase n=1 Tax=Bifidobacterium sp. ESL0769 TaxID=2983229 RepID=UPI0023F8B7B9|nr:RNA methyltransferase [Bifidobacterium sp. ESL0769]WEV66696.1 RNA methyltransferase [Bifidobacterium sp. ESL0769]